MDRIIAEEINYKQYTEIVFPENTFVSNRLDAIIFRCPDFDRMYILSRKDLEIEVMGKAEHFGKVQEYQISFGAFKISKEKGLYLLHGTYTWDWYAGTGRDDSKLISEEIFYNILTKKPIDKDLWEFVKFTYINLEPTPIQEYIEESELLYRDVLIAYERDQVLKHEEELYLYMLDHIKFIKSQNR